VKTQRVSTSGFRELEEALSKLPKATGKNVLRRVARRELEPMKDSAVQLAPDDPKTVILDIRRSIKIEEVKAKRAYGSVKYSASTGVSFLMGVDKRSFHAKFQEWGTVHHPAQQFMRPTWDSGVEPLLERLKDSLWAEVKKASDKYAKKLAKRGL
jgi:HK97 gp10 family phage protein